MCFPTNTGKKLTRMEGGKWLSLANVSRTGINDPQQSQRCCVFCHSGLLVFCSSEETHSYVISTVYLLQSLGIHAFKLLFSLWFS